MAKEQDYNNGKIYKLVSSNTDEIYIGSTISTLTKRNWGHLSAFKQWGNGKKVNNMSSFRIIEKEGDINIVLIELFPCNTKSELLYRERHWIENLTCVNLYRPIVSQEEQKEYYEQNKEKVKDYYEQNKEQILKKKKEQYLKNKEQILKKKKESYEQNKVKMAEKV